LSGSLQYTVQFRADDSAYYQQENYSLGETGGKIMPSEIDF